MEVEIHTLHFDADAKLEDFIKSKLSKIDKLSDHIISGDVTLKLNNSKTLNNKVVEVKLNAPGKDFFVRKQSKTFEEAIDASVSALKKQLEKYKKKNC